MEGKIVVREARLEYEPNNPQETANLYIPMDLWKALTGTLNSNKLTVVLRFGNWWDFE